MTTHIHPTADVSPQALIGEGTRVWHQAQVRPRAKIGQNCIISKAVFIDAGVTIGNNVKIQNYVSVYYGVTIEDGVFVGPHVCFTNDIRPRSINPDTSLKAAGDWILSKTLIRLGASIGANATILCGISVGAWAMIGAGSVVTHDIPDYGLAWGNPARLRGFVCPCGGNLKAKSQDAQIVYAECQKCSQVVEISLVDWELGG